MITGTHRNQLKVGLISCCTILFKSADVVGAPDAAIFLFSRFKQWIYILHEIHEIHKKNKTPREYWTREVMGMCVKSLIKHAPKIDLVA